MTSVHLPRPALPPLTLKRGEVILSLPHGLQSRGISRQDPLPAGDQLFLLSLLLMPVGSSLGTEDHALYPSCLPAWSQASLSASEPLLPHFSTRRSLVTAPWQGLRCWHSVRRSCWGEMGGVHWLPLPFHQSCMNQILMWTQALQQPHGLAPSNSYHESHLFFCRD